MGTGARRRRTDGGRLVLVDCVTLSRRSGLGSAATEPKMDWVAVALGVRRLAGAETTAVPLSVLSSARRSMLRSTADPFQLRPVNAIDCHPFHPGRGRGETNRLGPKRKGYGTGGTGASRILRRTGGGVATAACYAYRAKAGGGQLVTSAVPDGSTNMWEA